MLQLRKCNKTCLCVDCDDSSCKLAGKAESDCPKYRCDAETHDCNNCRFLKELNDFTRKQNKRKEKHSCQ